MNALGLVLLAFVLLLLGLLAADAVGKWREKRSPAALPRRVLAALRVSPLSGAEIRKRFGVEGVTAAGELHRRGLAWREATLRGGWIFGPTPRGMEEEP